jgi:hypothetical protein
MVSDVEKGRVKSEPLEYRLGEGDYIEDVIARQLTLRFWKPKLFCYSLGWLCAMGFWIFFFSLSWGRKYNTKIYLDSPCERYIQRECAGNRLQNCEGSGPSFSKKLYI